MRSEARNAISQGAKTELFAQLHCVRRVNRFDFGLPPRHIDRHRSVQSNQFLAKQCNIDRLTNSFGFLPFDLVRVGQHPLQRVKFSQQLGRGFRTDRRNAGHIVGFVSHHRLKVDHLIRANPPIFNQFGRPIKLMLAQVQQVYSLAKQLPAILVAGHQPTVASRLINGS